jgi:hypothetical protein
MMTKNLNNSAENFVTFFDQKLQFIYPRPPYRTSAPQEKPSALKRASSTSIFAVIFALLDPDLDPDCKSESGSRDPIGSGSTTLDYDAEH